MINKLKKAFLIVLIGSIVVVGLAGCSRKSEQSPNQQTPSEQPAQEHPSSEHPSGEHPK